MYKIAILDTQFAQKFSVFGLFEVLNWAISQGAPFSIKITADCDGDFDCIILPPQSELCDITQAQITALQTHFANGAVLAAVCLGVFSLAKTGLLNERCATTHWQYANRFREEFPHITLESENIIIDIGQIITCGGVMAWTNLAIHLIARFHSSELALKTAKQFLITPIMDTQSLFGYFTPSFQHGDASVLKIQTWLAENFQGNTTNAQLAARCLLSERNFMRRFRNATGFSPTQYLQNLRIEKARDLLENSVESFEQIAWRVGYQNPNSLRKIFNRALGATPIEYRRKFTLKP